MPKTIEMIFDFVSPNGYMAWFPLKDIVARHEAELTITPVFLGGMHRLTGNEPPMIRDAHIKGKNEYAALEMQRFIKKHELTRFKLNAKFPFNSITIQRLLLVAQEVGRDHELIDFMLPKVWEEGLDAEDPEAIAEVLGGTEFDAGKMLARTQDPEVKQQLITNTENAVERGVFGIPSFFVEGELFFGKDRLGQVEEEVSG
jgi:2-hydroxychromene-2-carboxylate isomerase